MKTFRVGTRGSLMALAQTKILVDALKAKWPGYEFENVESETKGDRDQVSRLGQYGGKGGAFIKDMRDLLDKEKVDFVMHSLKDMPGNRDEENDNYMVGAYLERDDPRDCLVKSKDCVLEDVLHSGTIGTNSVRRKAYIRSLYRGVEVVHSRGAVIGSDDKPGRIDKLDARKPQQLPYGGFVVKSADALVLAVAGIKRIGLEARIEKIFSIDEMCPAIGQGVVVAEAKSNNKEVLELLKAVNHPETNQQCNAERSMLKELNGHCLSPIAGHAWHTPGFLHLRGVVIHPDGRHVSEYEEKTDILDPETLGIRVAAELKARGADIIINQTRYLG